MKHAGKTLGIIAGLALMALQFGCSGDRYSQSTGEAIDSAAVTAKVKAAMIDDPSVSGMAVKVDTFKGVVNLGGFVDSPEQKKRAEDLAWGVEGVRGVKNGIVVKSNVPATAPGTAERPRE